MLGPKGEIAHVADNRARLLAARLTNIGALFGVCILCGLPVLLLRPWRECALQARDIILGLGERGIEPKEPCDNLIDPTLALRLNGRRQLKPPALENSRNPLAEARAHVVD